MRPTPNNLIEKYRRVHPRLGASPKGSDFGYFEVNGMRIISSGSHAYVPGVSSLMEQWEHVSVSLHSRIPTWTEMAYVKELFWRDEETVVQFHPKKSEYVNEMQFCLHLWKKHGTDFARPPGDCL